MKRLVFFLLVLIAFNCSHHENKTEKGFTKIDFNKIDEVDFFSVFDIKSLKLIQLGHSDSLILSSNVIIKKIDTLFFVYDKMTNQLYKFNENGKIINKIGIGGNAPEEYLNVLNFRINKGLVTVLTDNGKTLKNFDFNGNFISLNHLPINATDFLKVEDNKYWFYTGFYDKYRIYLCDSTNIIGSFLPNQNFNMFEFSEEKFFVNENVILYKDALIPKVYKINNDKLEPLYSINFDSECFTEDNIKNINTPNDFMMYLEKNTIYTIGQVLFDNNIEYFKIIKNFNNKIDIYDVLISKNDNNIFKISYKNNKTLKEFSEYLKVIDIEKNETFYFIIESSSLLNLMRYYGFKTEDIELTNNPIIISLKLLRK